MVCIGWDITQLNQVMVESSQFAVDLICLLEAVISPISGNDLGRESFRVRCECLIVRSHGNDKPCFQQHRQEQDDAQQDAHDYYGILYVYVADADGKNYDFSGCRGVLSEGRSPVIDEIIFVLVPGEE